jgi:hypothetical protein
MDRRLIAGFVAAVVVAVAIGFALGSRSDDSTTATEGSTSTTTTTTGGAVDESTTTTSSVPEAATTTARPVARPGRGVIIDGWIVGWWDGDDWQDGLTLEGQDPVSPIAIGDRYDFIDIDGDGETSAVTEFNDGCFDGENHPTVGDIGSDRVGVATGADLQPRPVAEIDSAPAHVTSVEDWLISEGVNDPDVSIDRVLRVDVDGDGVDEVFIEASKIENPDELLGEPAGSYSVLLYRWVDTDDDVQVTVIDGYVVDEANAEGDDFSGFMVRNKFLAVADLNGDAVFEIVTTSTYYEGSSATIRSISGGTAKEELTAGCGA